MPQILWTLFTSTVHEFRMFLPWFAWGAVILFGPLAMIHYRRRRTRTRRPFGENVRWLRAAGDRQAQLARKSEESYLVTAGLVTLAMIALTGACLILLQITVSLHPPGTWILAEVIACGCVLIAATIISVCVVAQRVEIAWAHFLGYAGERLIGDCLEPLKSEGWRIYHDLQCVGSKRPFNIDHIALGPNGIFAIETKTRRKRPGRQGEPDHVVTFDGKRIVWPRGYESASVEQAVANADWLRDWLAEATGRRFRVIPIIAVPGYFVQEAAVGPVRVAMEKTIATIVRRHRNESLTAADIDTAARALDARCRDLDYHSL